ncbi:MAG: hypothetical protein EOL93_00700 [Epsilonproteobacteria bacterium]|nr:hypothetical protein [Campylobacterota bacterium]
MFIEKSKQALEKTDAHTGERDYLHVKKDDTGFDIKVPNGKTKLKLTKGFGKSGEVSQEFDVVGSGNAIGVEGMNKIVVGNAFADDYCEAYSGYGISSNGADCAPKLAGAVDGIVVYRTPCPKEFFEFTLSEKQKIELYINDTVLIEKTYSAELKQNLNVRETQGLKIFEEYFGTGVILNELHEAKRIVFADGLPITIDDDDKIIVQKDSDDVLALTYGASRIYCIYKKNGDVYVCENHVVYFYFLEMSDLLENITYLKNNFISTKNLSISHAFEIGLVEVKLYAIPLPVFSLWGSNERGYTIRLYKENYEEILTIREEISISFLLKFKEDWIRENGLLPKINTISNANTDLLVDGQNADFYPTFYVPKSSIFDFTNPRSDKWVKTQYKFLDVIQGLGLYPVIKFRDTNNFSNIVNNSGEIYSSALGGWNNKKMLSLLESNPNVPKIKVCSNGSNHIWLVYAGYGSRSDYLSKLDKNYIPLPRWGYTRYFKYVDIGNQIKFVYDKSLRHLNVMADTDTPDDVGLIQRVITFIEEHISPIACIDFRGYTRVYKDSLILYPSNMNLLDDVIANFMNKSEQNKYTLRGAYGNLIENNNLTDKFFNIGDSIPIDKLKHFFTFINNNGVVLHAQNDTVSWKGYQSSLVFLYALLDSKDFVLKSLFVKNYERVASYPTYSYSYDYDYSHLWTTYADGHFAVREIINDGSNAKVPASLKKFLEEVLIPKLNTAYENLLHVKILVTNNGSELDAPLSTVQIQGLLRGLFNQFLLKRTMNIAFRATISYTGLNPYDGKLYTDGSAFNFSGVDALASVSVNATINYGGDVVENHISGVESASDDAVEPSEPPLDKVSITVTDSGKTRTIGYASPIAIESISVGGQRIDAINQKLKDGTLRKFSVGSSTVTWGGNMITIYNFSTVTSLKIGDASFVF